MSLKAEVHPGHQLMGQKYEEEEEKNLLVNRLNQWICIIRKEKYKTALFRAN
jgi:hypothetical protein